MDYNTLKNQAVSLRRQGFSYSEILNKVPVAKSTISLWLRSVGLSKRQEHRLTEKKLAAIMRGGKRKHELKLEKIQRIHKDAEKDITKISDNELFLIGITMYWAEGAKERFGRSTAIKLINSDSTLIKIFIIWVEKFFKIKRENLVYELYIHRNADLNHAVRFWAEEVKVEKSKIRVYYKPDNNNPKRKNIKNTYNGLLRVGVYKSVDLNRKIDGWINAIKKCII